MAEPAVAPDRRQQILDAVLGLLAERGIAGVSMRAVSRRAGVALGLVNYHYRDKQALVAAALRHIETLDLALLDVDPDLEPVDALVGVLRRVADPALLATDHLALRLQLWSLAAADPAYAAVNVTAQQRYRTRLAALIAAARPRLTPAEADERAADVDTVQNGIWLTALLGLDPASIDRSVRRCEEIALGQTFRSSASQPASWSM